MKKYIIAFLFLSAFIKTAFTQNTFDTAIELGSIDSSIDFTHTQDTRWLTDDYQIYGKRVQTKDVFYKFTLSRPLTVVLSHCDSELYDTYIVLFKEYAGGIEDYRTMNEYENDEDRCPSPSMKTYLRVPNLSAGTYYVMAEGYSENGNITTRIQAYKDGDSRQHPIKAGIFGDDFNYSDSQNLEDFTDQYISNKSHDIFYSFSLSKKMDITITHCESGLFSTFMTLLDSNGKIIEKNDYSSPEAFCQSSGQAFIQRTLDVGTYYVVSEGGDRGNIQTNIFGRLFDDFGYPDTPIVTTTSPEDVRSLGEVFDVSATGGAVFSVPIDIPPGVGGLQPAPAITYNSQSGNGIAGWGCNISGISAITKVPKSIYYDGIAKGVTGLADNAYVFDGQRLILVSGTPGREGAVYSPESDPFTKVIVHGTYTTTTANTWFEVEASDGMKYYYGNTADSRQSYTANGSPRINSWYINYAEDRFGNYINYSYTKHNNFVYLNIISYGKNKNESNSLQNSISFTYEDRKDAVPFVMEGVKGSMSRRLKNISTKINTQDYRTYDFIYDDTTDGTETKFSRLIRIQEYTKGDIKSVLKPTILDWSYLPAFSQTYTSPSVVNDDYHLIPFKDQIYVAADLDGDGLSDLIGIYSYITPTKGIQNFAHLRLSSTDASGNVSFGAGSLFGLGETVALDKNWVTKISGFSSIDIDGDGINELLITRLVLENQNREVQFMFYNHKWGNFTGKVLRYKLQRSSEIPVYAIGDINNDGKDNIVLIEKGHNSNKYPCGIRGVNDNGTTLYSVDLSLTLQAKPEKMFMSDYNGNGLNDILVFHEKGYTIFWNQGNGISSETFSDNNKTTGTDLKDVIMIREGDFNGDGLIDFIMNAKNDKKWYFAINNGDGTFTKKEACSLDHDYISYDNFNCFVFDLDGDGKSDVIINLAAYYGTMKSHTYWMRSNGNNLIQLSSSISNLSDDSKSSRFVLGDFNGDGQLQLMNYGYNCFSGTHTNPTPTWKLYKNNNHNVSRGKISRIKNSFGTATTISYSTLTDKSIYTKYIKEKESDNTYPVTNYSIPLHVVKTVRTFDGKNINYRYGGLKAHLKGKGLLGFTSTTITDSTLGITTESNIDYFHPTFFVPQSTTVKITMDGKTEKVNTSFQIVDKASKKYYVCPGSKLETDIYGNQTNTEYIYDHIYGYLKKETERKINDNLIKTAEYENYVLAGGRYQPGLITLTRKHADDGNSFTTKKHFSYNISKGYVTKIIDNYGSSLPMTTSHDYDTFGNLIYSKISGEGVADFINRYEYDNTKRFLAKSYTTPASVVKTYTYDIWGNMLIEKDETQPSNILTVTHTYDKWDNLVSTVYPDGLKTTFRSGWGRTSDKCYFTLTQGHVMPWVRTWYNNLGRETVTETVGRGGVAVQTGKTYNTKGRLERVSYKEGDISTWELYGYDNMGRVKTVTTSLGHNTGYEYNNRKTTVTVNGRKYIKTYDAWGNIKKSSDPVSSVSYTYHSSGQPMTVETEGAKWSYTYTDTGNKATFRDPNMTTISYTYDAAGRVLTEGVSPLDIRTNTYDEFGRITSSSMRRGTLQNTVYTYGTSGYSAFKLTKVQEGDNYTSFNYDKYGRKNAESRYIAGTASLSYIYTYNNLGQISRIAYPGSLFVYRDYDAYGNLKKVTAGTQPIWELNSHTGKTTSTKLGDSMTALETRNSYGLLTSQRTVAGSSYVHNMTYNFDAVTGNLKSRTGMISQTEYFDYDVLDRLTSVRNGTTLAMNMTYLANGNIDTKTGLGQYTYPSYKPYAVTTVENAEGVLPFTQQSMGYKFMNKASSVSQNIEVNSDDKHLLKIDYGPGEQRFASYLRKNSTTATPLRTILYAGDYERIIENGVTRNLHYISGGDGLAAVYVKQSGFADKVYFAHKDHLGSIVKLTEKNGTEVFKASYDAWGNRTVTNNTFDFHRGYTGHEHLAEFGLINMNGRMYDPVLARFLSPDPFVQMPDFSQNFNRYTYCLNNPLVYTDPSGEFFGLVLAIGMGATMNVMGNMMAGNINNGGDFFKAAGIGALGGAAGYGVGIGVSNMIAPVGIIGGFLNGSIGGFVGGFVTGTGNSWTQNASFGNGLMMGLRNGVPGSLTGGTIGGFTGGVKAYRYGGNIFTGNGSMLISDSKSLFGVIKADKSPLNTNEKVSEFLSEKGINLSDYNVKFVDVENSFGKINTGNSTYFRENGIIYKIYPDGTGSSIGGTTFTRIRNFKAYSEIFMSTHNTNSNFLKSLNHEFIHAWQWAKFGYNNPKEWYKFCEASAYLYTQSHYPQVTVPSYNGSFSKYLNYWPTLPSVD